MKSEINVKELVEIATKGTRKLKYLEWDYISIKYRYLPNNFLNRFMPFLRWDWILDDMKNEEDYEKIYQTLFSNEEPDEKTREDDVYLHGYPRKKWEFDFLPFYMDKYGNLRQEKPRIINIYYYARRIIRKWYCEKNLPDSILSKVINNDITFDNTGSELIAEAIAGSGKLKDFDTFFNFMKKCIESLAYLRSDYSIGYIIVHYHNRTMIENFIKESIDKITETGPWFTIFEDEISEETYNLLLRRRLELGED